MSSLSPKKSASADLEDADLAKSLKKLDDREDELFKNFEEDGSALEVVF